MLHRQTCVRFLFGAAHQVKHRSIPLNANLLVNLEKNHECRKGLSSNTLAGMITNLKHVLMSAGKGESLNAGTQEGNAACLLLIKQHLKIVREEQAMARIVPKQAKPMFGGKLNSISAYIRNRLHSFKDFLMPQEKYTLLRDQAMFKLQFFAGDRASDISNFPTQDIKFLPDDSGFVFNRHMFRKTLRGDDGKTNTFAILRYSDNLTCPIVGLETYISGSKSLGIDL